MSWELIFDHDFNPLTTTSVPWKVTAGNGTLELTDSANEWLTAGQAMKLTTSVTAAEATEVHLYVARGLNQNVVAFGGTFATMDENISNISFFNGWRDGTSWHRQKLLHVYATNLWQYDAGESGGASNTTFLTRDTSEASSVPRWHTFEIVCDFKRNRSVSVRIDDTIVYPREQLRVAADSSVPFMFDFAIETTNLGSPQAGGVILIDRLYAKTTNRLEE